MSESLGSRSFKRTITITCPAWCDEDPDLHVAELWEQDGHCLHQSRTVWVDDPTGFQRWPDELKPHEAIEVRLCASQTPHGKLSESPVMMVDHREVSIEQAEALAGALLQVVGAYRSGGVL